MSREPLKDTRLKFGQQVLPPYIFSFSVSLSLPTFISSPSLPLHPMNTLQPMNIPSEPDHSEWSRNLRWLNFLASVAWGWFLSVTMCPALLVRNPASRSLSLLMVPRVHRWCWQIRLTEDGSPRTRLLVDPCTLHRRAQGSWPSGRWCPPAVHVLEISHSLSTQPLAEWTPGATVRAILELAAKGSTLLPEGSNLHLYLSP